MDGRGLISPTARSAIAGQSVGRTPSCGTAAESERRKHQPTMKSPENTDTQRAAVAHQRLVLHLVPGKSYDTGKAKWRHDEIVDWHPNRAAARWLLGPCPKCGSITSNYGSAYSCHNQYCPNSASQFACGPEKTPDWWRTQVNVFLDGDAWCATLDGFINLQESVAGFGSTPRAAVENLLENA
jgi:hypothetical protein